MGDPYKGKIAGHALKQINGLVNPYVGICECGKDSGFKTTIKACREWHQQHKADKVDDFVANGCDDRGREVHL